MAARYLGKEAIGIEWDGNACETRLAAGLPTIHADVQEVRRNLRDHATRLKGVTILAGGPPCQTFSLAGSGSGRRDLDKVKGYIKRLAKDPQSADEIDAELAKDAASHLGDSRTALVLEPLRWILAAAAAHEPFTGPFETIILEQVPAVLPVWKAYEEALASMELPDGKTYHTVSGVLLTEQYGVPQTRRRAVLIAKLGDEETEKPKLPRKTHLAFVRPRQDLQEPLPIDTSEEEDSESVESTFPWVPMGDALLRARKDLGSSDQLPERSSEFSVRSNYGSGGDPKKRGQRTSDQPAFTVTGKVSRNVVTGDVGPSKFTIHEAGVLQTFPGNFPWSGKDQSQQVGNAVPPRLGVHLMAAALGIGKERRNKALNSMFTWPPVDTQETE